MSWRLVVWFALICGAGCVAPSGVPPVRDGSVVRTQAAHVGSQVDVVASDLAGTWVVRQAVAGAWPMPNRTLTFTAKGGDLGVRVQATPCADSGAGACTVADVTAIYRAGIAGRYALAGGAIGDVPLPAEIWVHWMDFDDRTLAIGNPNGGFVAILDRSATGGADRIAAARDILDWYGYDVSILVTGE